MGQCAEVARRRRQVRRTTRLVLAHDAEHFRYALGRFLLNLRRFLLRLVRMAADAQQALLQLAVLGQLGRWHDPVDAAVDHDTDLLGQRRGDADILLD
jgi:hypothetical protein